VGAANGAHARFREPEVFDLAFADQVFDGSCDRVDRDVRINAVLIEEIDPVDSSAVRSRS
jgi:hypothetical protein